MKRMIILSLIATLTGCASNGVRCNGALRPINAPELPLPVTHGGVAASGAGAAAP